MNFSYIPLTLATTLWVMKNISNESFHRHKGVRGYMCSLQLVKLRASMTGEVLHAGSHYIHCDPAMGQNPQNIVPLHGCQKS